MSTQTASAIALARGPLIGTFLALAQVSRSFAPHRIVGLSHTYALCVVFWVVNSLYGVTCAQALFYFRTYERDGWRLKMTVAFLLVLDTVHAAMAIWVMDDYLIVQYGNIKVLQSGTWSFILTYILGLLIDFYVYLYFTWRVWLFTQKVWIVVLMCAISISRTGISIIATVFSVLKPTWQSYFDTAKELLIIGNILFIIGDTFSACAMAYQLTRFKSWTVTYQPTRRRDPRRIDLLLNRLIMFSVATGALTVLVDVIALILTLALPQTLAFLSAILVQTHLYANSLLASLNIRNAAASAYDDPPSAAVELHATVPLQFARPLDLSTISEDDYAPVRVRDVNKPVIESWGTSQVQSRTWPQI
ncbi:hypothetical protein JVU11DRAFT_11635 [Chiua virens]|nr:hypothetical protein JVU11DRAFT_11635 [Chiua virens]